MDRESTRAESPQDEAPVAAPREVPARGNSPRPEAAPLHIGVSACLLGTACRYDGTADPLAPLLRAGTRVRLVPVCPEVELGMPTPREPIELVGPVEAPRLVGVVSGVDHTEAMQAFAQERIARLAAEGLDGFVLQARSPSCGIGSTRRRPRPGAEPVRDGTGLFAAALRARWPEMPMAERNEVDTPEKLEAFLARAWAYSKRSSQGG